METHLLFVPKNCELCGRLEAQRHIYCSLFHHVSYLIPFCQVRSIAFLHLRVAKGMNYPSLRRQCPCHGVVTVLSSNTSSSSSSRDFCPTCVQNSLQNLKQLHEAALENRNSAREECLQRLSNKGQRVSELGFESERLREKLTKLREECGSLAVQVASQVVENDARRDQTHYLPKQQLERLKHALYDPEGGAMTQAIATATDTVKRLRFAWALQVFGMFRLDVAPEEKRPTERQRNARGIGKIGGLPLPHAGPELYGPLPQRELQSALRLVAGLTLTLARCLGVILPHPILLQPHQPQGDIIESVSVADESMKETAAEEVVETSTTSIPTPPITTTASSIMSLMETSTWGRSARTVLQRATGTKLGPTISHQPPPVVLENQLVVVPPSMDSTAVSQRLLHAKAAVLAETAKSAERFALVPSAQGDEFAIGLQLLQNDVVALCIRVGVPVSELWPAGAILLNLQALMRHCQRQVMQCEDE